MCKQEYLRGQSEETPQVGEPDNARVVTVATALSQARNLCVLNYRQAVEELLKGVEGDPKAVDQLADVLISGVQESTLNTPYY
ncbi:MAG: hypothetical protein UU73_C0001G0305 [Candidatus Daviesbacteria bacterium GW2011_GWA1_41_61]|uniref:Uncharacterized protein n=1 Tax=Candidatus Daviesbacteria bacterium GW2011_GWA2_40_9 TaxID=1618424 RepID=A0A0G0WGV0_9BACT|nr:MAG: hypothetical protein UU26_C0029G0015 [Candidatus Daviesbacteria bacterium GW2011_GWC1_40_9]KKR83555.1 MAG: hypothetical protein UU29_C0004G0056 [Candidatus Daviesbacteria bacterium GW2011_GWA2_40_9]KKR93124.1 MAG: hypothetical protein UU44_C0004G0306 [Candidatus Daviesbacteria bacterium GW2011_GWB1_41_15]KKS15668.1 MAG: hypothetical protein UU73_C0001G0305 [Candidatus Daviesbacteria bacterium GW2011_GWA1_41_61]